MSMSYTQIRRELQGLVSSTPSDELRKLSEVLIALNENVATAQDTANAAMRKAEQAAKLL